MAFDPLPPEVRDGPAHALPVQELPEALATREAVLSFCVEAVEKAEATRKGLDEMYRVNKFLRKQGSADLTQKAAAMVVQRHGYALGVLVLAFRLGQIDHSAYVQLVMRVRATYMPGATLPAINRF